MRERASRADQHRPRADRVLEGVGRELERRRLRRHEPGVAAREQRDLQVRTRRGGLADEPLEDGRDRVDGLAGRQTDRDVGLRLHGQHGLLQERRAAGEAVDVDRRLGPRAEVELVRRALVGGRGGERRELRRAGRQRSPALELLVGRRSDAGAQRLRHAAVARHDARERRDQRMQRVQRSTPEDATVQVLAARPDGDVEVAQAAHGHVEGRPPRREHAAVEDEGRVRPTLVLGRGTRRSIARRSPPRRRT